MEDRVNILLVDDRSENLLALESVLTPLGENLVQASSGEEALREVLKHDFAVILMDANMPGMDGYETARLLQRRRRSAATPVIFITANDPDRRRVAHGYAAGAVDYIVKPFEPEILVSKVRVFINLMRKSMEVERQTEELKKHNEYQRELIDQNQILEQRLADRAAEAERRAALLRVMAVELTQAEQRERRRLSQVLHDHLQQILVTGLFKLGMLEKKDAAKKLFAEELRDLTDLMRQSLEASRSLTVELSPPVLYDGGFAIALQWLGRQMFEKHGLEVEMELEIAEDPPNEHLKVLLFYAVRELLFNVFKHAGVQQVRLSAVALNGELCINIEDNGVGFDPAVLETDERKLDSFGLISIRKRLEIFGGRFQIVSSPGKGTRATLCTPLEQHGGGRDEDLLHLEPRPYSETGTETPVPPEDGRYRVLLVDDHDILREGLATLLRNLPDMCIVGEAKSGEEAIDMVRRHKPDVVVMDISLPGMSGMEATRHIMNEFPRVRVVGLSMHNAKDMAQVILRAGAKAYVSKDEPTEHLIAAIRETNGTGGGKARGRTKAAKPC